MKLARSDGAIVRCVAQAFQPTLASFKAASCVVRAFIRNCCRGGRSQTPACVLPTLKRGGGRRRLSHLKCEPEGLEVTRPGPQPLSYPYDDERPVPAKCLT